MVVSDTHRRLGIGAALLHTLIAHAREQGLSSVFLTTMSFQIPAMRMYEKVGFVVQWKKYPMKFIPTFSMWVVEMKLDLTKV
jgi:ribosomal protein S18 acetylase RimI-like enzyme